MGVDDEPGCDPERSAEHDVSCLPRDPGKRQNLLHRLRYFAPELGSDLRRSAMDRFGFVAVEPRRSHQLLELGAIGCGEVGRLWVAREKRRRDFVHTRVGALSREDGGDEKLKWVLVGQRARRAGVRLAQTLNENPAPRRELGGRFGFRGQIQTSTTMSSPST